MSQYLNTALFGLSLVAIPATYGQLTLNPVSSIRNGDAVELFDESAAEIVSYDARTQRMFVVNGATDSIDIFDVSDIEAPVLFTSVDLSAYGNPNSVDVNPRWWKDEVAVAVGASEADERGTVVLISKDGSIKSDYTVGYLPDMLTYDKYGRYLVVANEAEPNDAYTFDPEGSVSILQARGFSYSVSEVGFGDITEEDLNGARISGPEGTSIAQDLEPEYVTISGRYAYVVCQENNAIVVVDLFRKTVSGLFGLGTKNFAELGNAIDASDKDDTIRIANWPVKGLYMPDSIASYRVGRETYIVTANEGDGREYEFEDEISFIDESRVKDLEADFGITLDPSAFPLAEQLVASENLGRLKVLVTQGDVDGDGDFDELYTYGGRSFSIFSTDGELVYDSGDFIESYIALNFPADFNSTNDESGSTDDRSDAKGPEPEALTLGQINGRTYAFLGLERQGGIMVFDITNPEAVSFVDYHNNRDFSVDFDEDNLGNVADAGDLGPEGLEFVPAYASPSGTPILLVANEVSGTTTIYEIDVTE
ncbi:choice-of-anchor I family protein [Coraliomargarita akajimensis]|uniref:MerR family transcriptional regulator n=1 Tax=Coraliomargarita akajimensis (strain DSM 45221 / IAM 15411 / JCM 23193 / KCTC 12865 / 04OKA010-24) TaxID=583355 RepID=D5ENY4_CORAD|nr:choice-of-anchor I family protein [Coraliomargarita akajimensis]ADE53643.1 MerR family transcriptional regulator [Coraliomargarita akajimensis DSM 45221]